MMQRLHLFGLLFFALILSFPLRAQSTIFTGSLPTTSICPGYLIDVSFTQTGSLSSTYVVQLSNGGDYVNIPTGTVRLTGAGVYTVAATIPSNTAAGTTYRLRVTGSNPAVIGTPSPTMLSINRPNRPNVSSNVVTLCQFQTAGSLSASVTAANAVLIWYGTNATGGSGTTAPTIPSTSNAGIVKYYVAQKQNDCESERAEITVDVKAASPPPTVSAVSYCQGAQANQLSAVAAGGGSLTWYTSASGGTGSSAGPTPSTTNAGIQTYYVSQTVANSCESQRIPLTVTINGIPSAPSLPTPTYTFCQNAQGEILVANGQNLRWYETATGGTSVGSIRPSTSVAGTRSYYVSQTVSGCEGPRSSVNVNILSVPAAPTVSQTNYEFCQGTSNATITGNIAPGISTNWYIYGDEPGLISTYTNGNTAYATVSTAQARVLTYSLFQTAANGCVGPASQQINITVKPTPTTPTVQAINICQNTAAPTLQANGQNLLWYGSNTGGTGSVTTPVVSTSQAVQTTYYVSQTVNGCESIRAALLVTINAIPGVPTVALTGPSYCQNASATALTATGQGLKWYRESSGGTSLGNTVTPETKDAGSFTYYVSQTVSGCESGRSSFTVKVSAAPSAPAITSAYSYCQKAVTAPISATGTALKWYGAAGNVLANAPTPSSETPGTVSYFVTQTPEGCESSKAEIKVTIKPTPAAPGASAISVCQNATGQTISANGQNLLWYTAETGGSGTSTAPTVNTSQPAAATYYVSQTVEGCEGPRAALIATVKLLPGVPMVANTGPSYCQNAQASALTATGNDLKWYRESSGGTSLGANPVPETKDAGNFTYYVSQTVDGCEGSRSSTTIKISALPAAPVVTSAFSYCQKATTSVLTATGTTIRWYDANGMLLANAPTPSSETPGTVSYFVTQTPEGCESSKAEIKVATKPTPGAPGVSAVSVCQNVTGQTISANGQNLLWYTAETGGGSTPTAPVLNTAQPSQTNYYVSQTVEGCEGPRATLAVTVKSLPPAPTTAPKEICQFAKADLLTAQGQTNSELRWYFPDGVLAGTTPTPPTEKGATYVYQVSQVVNGCEGPRAPLTVNILATPLPAVSKPTVELCQNAIAQPLEAAGANLKWTNPSGAISTTAPVPPTTTATNNPDGDVYFVTQTISGCESAKVAVKVFVQTAPTMTILGTITTNLGLEVPLKLTFTGVGPYNYKLSNGLSGMAVKDTTILVLPERTTTYQVAEVTNKCGVGLSGNSAAVTVTVLVPTIQTAALASTTTTTLCAGATLITNFTTTGTFNSGSVFKLQMAKVETDSTKISYVDVAGSQVTGGQITGNLPANLISGQYLVRVIATNPKIPINGNRSPTLLTVRSRATATLTGTQSIFEGQPAKLSIAFTGDGPWTFSYRDSTDSGLGDSKTGTAGVNPYSFDIMPTKTTAYRLTSVDNGCGPDTRTGGVITVQVNKVLGIDDQTLADAVDVYPVPTTTTLTVRVKGLSAAQPAVLELTDLTGRTTIQHETRRETSVLTLGQLSAGVYILRIRVGDRIASKRIVKL